MESGPLTEALRETLAVFEGSGEPRTTPEVADRLDLGRRSTYARLERLVERDLLETKKVGANARVWWRRTTTAVVEPPESSPVAERSDDDREKRTLTGRGDRSQSELDEVITRISDGFFAVDDEWELTYLNETIAELLGSTAAELQGENLWETFPALTGTEFEQTYREAMTTQEPCSLEAYYPPFDGWYRDVVYPSASGLSIYVLDVTERKRREQKLEQYERIVETVGDGIYVLDSDNRFTVVNGAFASTTGSDHEELVGTRAETVLGETLVDAADEKQAELESTDLDIAVLEGHLKRADGTSAVVESRFSLFEFEGGETGQIGVVRDVTDRVEYERELERRREQLAALNSLNEVVNEVTDAVIGQSTRTEIERTVCEHLVDSDSYLFAWIGDVDAGTQMISLRTEAGTEGYLDEIAISVDPDDERSKGPTGRAFRTGEMQTIQDVLNDPAYEPWRETAREYGFRSSAAVPIVHESIIYGVLNVYAERPFAFDERERTVIAQLGEIVGHAIAATERKRALMSDDLVALEFQIQDVFTALETSTETEDTITFDRTIPLGDDEFLVYGTATGDAIDTVPDLVETIPHGEEAIVRSAVSPPRFEIRLSDPPVLPAIASVSGYVDSAVIENGDYRVTIHLAPSVDVRRVVDVVETAYPQAELLSHRQITRSRDDPRSIEPHPAADLTDRQRAALTAAYHAGFFEWPRERTGEDVAESLEIAPSTFHQHLRRGQRKVFERLFSTREDVPKP
jgi:HTH-type transcriptional regulator, bacterioopsin transcriptional activator and related proteins